MKERYPGERRGLRLFLEGLIDAVDEQLGRDALLYHRIRLALERGDLVSLRAARQMFNHQETALKRRLSLARQERRTDLGLGTPRHVMAHGTEHDAPPQTAAVLTLPRRDPIA